MRLIDFIYDGVRASSMGLTNCLFEWQSSSTWDIGNDINPNPTKAIRTQRHWSIGPVYTDVYEADLYIMRDPCLYEMEDERDLDEWEFSDIEINRIVAWLNRKTYHRFEPIYENNEFDQSFFMATFNIDLHMIGTHVVGFRLHMMTNAPYAWNNPVTYEGEFRAGDSLSIKSISNEYGAIYLDMVVVPYQSGTFTISNDADRNYQTIVENVTAYNSYHFHENIKQLELEMGAHPRLPNDFNYKFPRIITTRHNAENNLTFSLDCWVKCTYVPVMKVGFVG